MYWFLILLLLGLFLAGASAFTAAYSGWWGERGGKIATSVLRNFLSIPIWCIGLVMAYLQSAPALIVSGNLSAVLGWTLMVLGFVPVTWGHLALGWKTHFPSIKDPLVRDGIYAYVRHPCRRATHAFRCDAVETDLDFSACQCAWRCLAFHTSAVGRDRFVATHARVSGIHEEGTTVSASNFGTKHRRNRRRPAGEIRIGTRREL